MSALSLKNPWVKTLLFLNAVLLGFIFYLAPRVVMRVRMPDPPPQMPVIAEITPFTLIRENASEFSSNDLEGRRWIASFIFTRCAGQCPLLSSRLAALQKDLPEQARIVSFTVDPSYDSPQQLQAYASRYGADPGQWVHLTGDAQTIRRIQSELKLSSSDDPGMHSLRFFLMEGLRARGIFDSTDAADLEKLKKALVKMEHS